MPKIATLLAWTTLTACAIDVDDDALDEVTSEAAAIPLRLAEP